MELNEDLRSLSRRSITLSAVTIAIKALKIEVATAATAFPLLKLGGTQNLAVVSGVIGFFVTIYFLLRVIETSVAADLGQRIASQGPSPAARVTLQDAHAAHVERSVALHDVIRSTIEFFDIWLPVILCLVATAVVVPNAITLVLSIVNRR